MFKLKMYNTPVVNFLITVHYTVYILTFDRKVLTKLLFLPLKNQSVDQKIYFSNYFKDWSTFSNQKSFYGK